MSQLLRGNHGLFRAGVPSSFIGFLDIYPDASAAFSLRRLRSGYIGPLVRVRRSSDDAELDIGYTSGGMIDLTALLTHCGAGSGFVSRWYDQSSNTPFDLIQNTASKQPRIVDAGVYESGGMYLNGSSSEMVNTSGVMTGSFTDQFSVLILEQCLVTEAGYLISWAISGQGSAIYPNSSRYDIRNHIAGGDSIPRTGIENIAVFFYDNQNTQMALNGVDGGATGAVYNFTASSANLVLGNRQGGSAAATYYAGNVKEVILYNVDHRATRVGMQANMNAFWSVF